jgi:hypothetical protein
MDQRDAYIVPKAGREYLIFTQVGNIGRYPYSAEPTGLVIFDPKSAR